MPFPDGIADFRSDTVTRPTREMIEAMASAPLGDDVYSDDPTVNQLEEESAAVTGMEAAIYVPTGTMGNQLSIMAQTHPGEEVLAHEGSHVRSIEAGPAGSVRCRFSHGERGRGPDRARGRGKGDGHVRVLSQNRPDGVGEHLTTCPAAGSYPST